jgi:hypothetical protein
MIKSTTKSTECKTKMKSSTPDVCNHLKGGKGCLKCNTQKKYHFNSRDEFLKALKKIHGNTYDYSKVEFPWDNTGCKITIICPNHGEFQQTVYSHMYGSNCPQCARLKCIPVKTTERFISDSIQVYTNKYDYSKTVYVNFRTKVIIICPEHGEFLQTPDYHLKGLGCLKCKRAKSSNIKVVEIFSCSRLSRSEKYKGIYNPLKRR